MATSQRLRLADVRRAAHLVGEALELWDDPAKWQPHVLHGLQRLCGGEVMTVQALRVTHRGEPLISGGCAIGWRDPELAQPLFDSVQGSCRAVLPLPGADRLFGGLAEAGQCTYLRQELCDRPAYEASPFYQQFRRPTHCDEYIVDIHMTGPARGYLWSLNKPHGEPPYERRAGRLARLVLDELAPLIGTRLNDGSAPAASGLSPRRRKALAGLLRGLSEKELAHEMKIALPTLHTYVTDIYRHFCVNSRAELMAYFVARRLPGRDLLH